MYINEEDVEDNLEYNELINGLETVFQSYEKGKSKMPPKSYLEVEKGDFRAMPAYINIDGNEASGVKWVSVFPENPKKDLETVIGNVILTDPETGEKMANIEANHLTGMRTGSVAGLATRYLSKEDSEVLGLIGLGEQSHHQLKSILEVREIEKVIIKDLKEKNEKNFKSEYPKINISIASDYSDFKECDIISTMTPTRDAYLDDSHLSDDVHINAMGADAEGKQELKSQVTLSSRIIVDDYEQCLHSGEVNNLHRDGSLSRNDITATLGELIIKGDDYRQEKTIFDSTGLAIQDITASKILYDKLS